MRWIKIKDYYLDLKTISRIIIQEDFISLTSPGFLNAYTSRTDRKIMGEKLSAKEFTTLKENLEKLLKDTAFLL